MCADRHCGGLSADQGTGTGDRGRVRGGLCGDETEVKRLPFRQVNIEKEPISACAEIGSFCCGNEDKTLKFTEYRKFVRFFFFFLSYNVT